MKNKAFKNYYILSVIGVLLASFYPLYMGIKVVVDMITNGVVTAEDYPKYIIPYTPISLAIIFGVAIMPLMMKFAKKMALLPASVLALGIFLASELMLESMVIVEESLLGDWQMYLCVALPEAEKVKAIEYLVGDYNPWFKLHFYVISVVIILSFLNCFYGFGQMIKNNDKRRLKPLVIQSVFSVIFLELCLLACFTAFFRGASLYISPLSGFLMGLFFVTLGVTTGVYTGSFLYRKKKKIALLIPTAVAVITTIVMYIGELILLDGKLYRIALNSEFFRRIVIRGFEIVFAPVDLLVIILSGLITAGIMLLVIKKNNKTEESKIL